MENQHRAITGYRELNQEEVDLMNKAKALGNQVGEFLEGLDEAVEVSEGKIELDPRWVAVAKTDLQKGFMALIRAIAKPSTFC